MGHKKVERIDPLSRALPLGGVDSHAHLDDPDFDPDREDVLARARAAGLANVGNVFLGPDDFVARRALFDKHPEVFFLLGIHPQAHEHGVRGHDLHAAHLHVAHALPGGRR